MNKVNETLDYDFRLDLCRKRGSDITKTAD